MTIRLSIVYVILLLLSAACITSTFGANSEGWIVGYKIEDLRTRQLILERDLQTGKNVSYAPIFAGSEYNFTVTIKVPLSAPNKLKLSTNLLSAKPVVDRYWELHSKDYPIVNYNPNSTYIEFNQTKGTLVISLYGKPPPKITERVNNVTGEVMHIPVMYPALVLSGPPPANDILGEITIEVVDADINQYRNLLSEKEILIEKFRNENVEKSYIQLFENIIALAKNEAEKGYVKSAIDLLTILTDSNPPKEPTPSIMETLFIPVTAALIIAFILAVVMLLKTRGKIAYIVKVIEDQIKDLEGIGLRASKIDKSISSSLENLKDKLKSLVGA
jgi:hypothetical protein